MGENVSFSDALYVLKAGSRITRAGWNGRNMWIALQIPDENSKMTLPYIYMYTAQGEHVPWVASHSDLMATDWFVVP